jgi:hypothetical protein
MVLKFMCIKNRYNKSGDLSVKKGWNEQRMLSLNDLRGIYVKSSGGKQKDPVRPAKDEIREHCFNDKTYGMRHTMVYKMHIIHDQSSIQ